MWPALPTTDTPVDWDAAALRSIRDFCGWHVAPVISETITLDGSGARALLVPSNRVLSLEDVTEDGAAVDPDTIQVSPHGVLRKRDGLWTDALGGVTVTLKHGHEQFDAIAAVVELVSARSAATGGGAVQESAGPFSIRRSTDGRGGVASAPLLQAEKDMLAPYVLTWGV